MPRKVATRTLSSAEVKVDAISVALLGPFELRCENAVQHLPKKSQALLAYLAMHQDQSVPRDHLATLLWGNTASDQARQSLRQCLVALRLAFGTQQRAVVASDAKSVTLQSSGGLLIDVVAFKTASLSSSLEELERANSLFRDEFLAGLRIPVEPYNHWVSLERQRLAALKGDLLLRLAQARASAGDSQGAVDAAQDLTVYDPAREHGHRLLMRLLAASGQRSAALRQYEKLTKLLQDQLGLAPDAETTSLAEKIRKGRDAVELLPQSLPISRGLSVPVALHKAGSRDTSGPALPDRPSIVVLPFANLSGDAGHNYFIDGLVEDITIALGREKWLFVIASPSAFFFRDSEADPRDVGTRLGVQYILRGSVRRSANRVRVVVLLTDATSGEFIWSDRFEDNLDNVFDMSDRLVAELAAMITPALRSIEIERAQRKPPTSLSAFECYLQAVPKLRTDLAGNQVALHLLEQAIALDPSYSVAYALAARCYQFQRLMGWVPLDGEPRERGAGFARLAIELGKNDSEALWMAAHAITQFTGEVELAHDLMDRSLKLNPNSASAWSSSCYLQTLLGDFERAIKDFHRSQRLNPLDQMHHVHWNIVGMAYFGAARYHEANAAADEALNVRPAYPQALRLKIAACGALGLSDEGQANVQRLLAVHPECSLTWLEEFHRPMMVRAPKLLDRYMTAARKAGMPEVSRRVAAGPSIFQ